MLCVTVIFAYTKKVWSESLSDRRLWYARASNNNTPHLNIYSLIDIYATSDGVCDPRCTLKFTRFPAENKS